MIYLNQYKFFIKDLKSKRKYFILSFIISFIFLLIDFNKLNLLAAFDITIIPQVGVVSDAFRSGDFSFKIILLFGMHLIQLGAVLSGVTYVIMNVYSGLQYIMGSTMGDKSAGTNSLINAFFGFILTVSSWVIVDIFLSFLAN
jgi:hypothetical protein